MTRCSSWRWHRFEPRFDIVPPTKVDFGAPQTVWDMTFSAAEMTRAKATVINALTKKNYVRDVCTRCGATVERAS